MPSRRSRLVDVERGLVHRAERRQRIEGDRHVGAAEFVERVERRRAELGDVGEDRHLDRGGKPFVHRELGDRLGKDHVGAGLDASAGAIDRRLQSLDRERVGAGHDHEAGIGARIDGGLDSVDHFLLRDELLVRPVPAALRADLILDVHRACAELDQRFHRARDVERGRAEARVHVDQQRQRRRVRDPADVGQHIVEVADAEIRQAERAGGDAAARQVDRLEPGALGEDRVVRADRAGNLQWRLRFDRGAESRAGGGGGHGGGHGARVSREATATPARSSSSSFSVASIRSRENASIGSPVTRAYSLPAVVTGTPYITSCGMP